MLVRGRPRQPGENVVGFGNHLNLAHGITHLGIWRPHSPDSTAGLALALTVCTDRH